ncbi:MAG: aminoacetone oxidase family FAD-binding enzyme [Clostridiales bacterium]|nr:aminoacetone oxidase family FAD-binding enzyme [Clostridiales bacterium]
MYDVIIVGAGASGLVAAYELVANNQRLKILVIEKERIPGRKLNATGNGKGNLTNKQFGVERLYCSQQEFINEFVMHHSSKELVNFFEQAGILLYEKDGYYYPVCNQAKQITDILYARCCNMGIKFVLDTEVFSVSKEDQNKAYIVKAEEQNKNGSSQSVIYHAVNVILCTGGMAAPKLGGTDSGYRIAKNLKLSQEKVVPVLTPAYVEDKDLRKAKGVRLNVSISLYCAGKRIRKESGQLQINEDSLSGIAMMNLSCYFNHFEEEEREECLQIDTFPDMTWDQLKEYIKKQSKAVPYEALLTLLEALFPLKFGEYLIKRLGMEPELSIGELTEKQINRMTSLIKKLTFTPVKRMDFEKAQVTAGGVSVEEVNIETFECKKYPGLYITGELLDVNGECGGYNLTFAMLSGLQAAHAILSYK